MNKLLTICTAAYNAEPYIAKMLDSLITSKYRDCLEIIVVNDGSTDYTQSIVEKYVKQYPAIVKLIKKDNGGSGSARNIAFELATGEYLKLIDADDWVNTNNFDMYIEKLMNVDVDVVWNGSYRFYVGNNTIREENHWRRLRPNQCYKLETDILQIPSDMEMHGITYKTAIFKENNIKMSEGLPYVDLEYIALPIPYIKTAEYIDSPFYVYQLGLDTQSINPKMVKKRGKKVKTIAERLIEYYHSKKEEMCLNHLKMMKVVLAKACAVSYNFYLVQEKFDLRNEVIELDKWIKMQDEEIWSLVPRASGSVRVLRKLDYWGYYPMVILHKLIGIWKAGK